MTDPNFERVQILCPKCGSPRLVIQDIYAMWESKQPKNAMPNFGASFKKRVLCADCGAEVWPKKWVGPDMWPDDMPTKEPTKGNKA